jgi:hypothetical protein
MLSQSTPSFKQSAHDVDGGCLAPIGGPHLNLRFLQYVQTFQPSGRLPGVNLVDESASGARRLPEKRVEGREEDAGRTVISVTSRDDEELS